MALPPEFRALMDSLINLEKSKDSQTPDVYSLRRRLAVIFGEVLQIGRPESTLDDEFVARRIGRGVDQRGALAGWRTLLASNETLEFPGADHQVRFCVRLPLANGTFVEFATAVVSMPYIAGDRIHRNLEDAKQIATTAGWTAQELKQWSWFAPGETTLWLYKRSETTEEIARAWPNSFKRWLIENETRLLKASGGIGRLLIQELLTCPHLPLDVVDYDDFRERYLKEMAPEHYAHKWDTVGLLYSKLIDKWKTQLSAVGGKEYSPQK